MPTDTEYSIGELAGMAGVTPRTIRYYVSIGLLPAPGQTGPQARYGEAHLARLRLIRRLQRGHLPLGEIARQLEKLDDDAVRAALDAEEPGSLRPAGDMPDSALDYIKRLRTVSDVRPRYELAIGPAVSAPDPGHGLSRLSSADPSAAQRTQWERVPLGQNVELHIRRPLGRLDQKRVERLIRIGREILEEDQP